LTAIIYNKQKDRPQTFAAGQAKNMIIIYDTSVGQCDTAKPRYAPLQKFRLRQALRIQDLQPPTKSDGQSFGILAPEPAERSDDK
jgi:hypothetical protein